MGAKSVQAVASMEMIADIAIPDTPVGHENNEFVRRRQRLAFRPVIGARPPPGFKNAPCGPLSMA
jgi:hypothetical protein